MAKNLDHFALTEAQKLLAPYLDPGEKLLWAERRSFWLSLRAFPLQLLYNFATLLLLLLSFGVVILPVFFLEAFDLSVFSFLLFNLVVLSTLRLEGVNIFRNNLRSLYALSNRRAFFIATKQFVEIDAVSLYHLIENKIQTYGTSGSIFFPHIRRWGRTQPTFRPHPQLGFFAIPAVANATAALQATLHRFARNDGMSRTPLEKPPSLFLRRKPSPLFRRLSISFVEEVLERVLKEYGHKIHADRYNGNENINWVGRPQLRQIIFSFSFFARLSIALFFTGFLFLALFYREAPLSISDFFIPFFIILVWIYTITPIINGFLQTYALSDHYLYILHGWATLSTRIVELADLDCVQFIHRRGNTGSIGFGFLNQKFSTDKKPVLFLNKFGFFHIEKMDEVKTLVQEAIRRARRDRVIYPNSPFSR